MKYTIFSDMVFRKVYLKSITSGIIYAVVILLKYNTQKEWSSKGTIVGEYEADLLVDEKIIVGLKVAKEYNPKAEPQLLNELKAINNKAGYESISGKIK